MALGVSCVLGLGSAPERVQVTLELKARQKAAFVGRLQSATPTRRIRMQKGEGCDRRGPPRRVDHFSFTAACVRFYLGLGKARGRKRVLELPLTYLPPTLLLIVINDYYK